MTPSLEKETPGGLLVDLAARGLDLADLEAKLAAQGWPLDSREGLHRFVVLAGVPGSPPIFAASTALPGEALDLVAQAHHRLSEQIGEGLLAPWTLMVAAPLKAQVISLLREAPGH